MNKPPEDPRVLSEDNALEETDHLPDIPLRLPGTLPSDMPAPPGSSRPMSASSEASDETGAVSADDDAASYEPEPRLPDDEPTSKLPKPAIEAAVELTAEEESVRLRHTPARPRTHRPRRPLHEARAGMGCLVAIFYAAFILGVSMILSSYIILFTNEVFAFVKPDVTTVIEITDTDTFSTISRKLQSAGLIRYSALFDLYLNVAKPNVTFEPGRYEVSAKLDYPAMARALYKSAAARETVRVTIPEGYTSVQIAAVLDAKNVCTQDSFWAAVENGSYDFDFLADSGTGRTRLEGFLFPDTYEFYLNDNAEEVVGKFLSNFDGKFDDLRADAAASGYSFRELVIIASMIEREAYFDEERPVIASVIFNRLGNPDFPYLQIDATVAYILGRAPTNADLNISDPYNTYVNEGLPPGPISNPGLKSLRAAVFPATSEYYYYVARRDRSHIFSRTAEEHAAAVAEVRG